MRCGVRKSLLHDGWTLSIAVIGVGRSVVRLMKAQPRFTHNTDRGMELNANGAWLFLDDILAVLSRLKGGKG